TSEESRVTGHLGPDLLGPDWDTAEAVRRLSAESARPIGEALLDQRNLAGIGNVYKAEVLFLRGLNPWQPPGSGPDLGAVAGLARGVPGAKQEAPGQNHRGQQARGGGARVRGPRGPAVPPVRDTDPFGGPGRRGHVLVPVLSARLTSPRPPRPAAPAAGAAAA